jgi:hypothetical protein
MGLGPGVIAPLPPGIGLDQEESSVHSEALIVAYGSNVSP